MGCGVAAYEKSTRCEVLRVKAYILPRSAVAFQKFENLYHLNLRLKVFGPSLKVVETRGSLMKPPLLHLQKKLLQIWFGVIPMTKGLPQKRLKSITFTFVGQFGANFDL